MNLPFGPEIPVAFLVKFAFLEEDEENCPKMVDGVGCNDWVRCNKGVSGVGCNDKGRCPNWDCPEKGPLNWNGPTDDAAGPCMVLPNWNGPTDDATGA